MIGRVYFQGMYFKLNESYDLFDFCKLSIFWENVSDTMISTSFTQIKE